MIQLALRDIHLVLQSGLTKKYIILSDSNFNTFQLISESRLIICYDLLCKSVGPKLKFRLAK